MTTTTPSPSTVRIGLAQHACTPDREHNLQTVTGLIQEAAERGARFVVLQELFTGPYFPQTQDSKNFELAEPIPGPTTTYLCNLAARLNISIVGSIFERRAQGVYHNTAVTIAPTGTTAQIVGTYRKMHIPDDPRFYEKYYFTPGDAPGWRVHQAGPLKAGVLICWDQWFPEAARLTAMMGAQVICYPTAIGWWSGEDPDERHRQLDAWLTVQRAHAITNGVFVVAVNRTGVEGDLQFWGSSFVVDPGGSVIAQATQDQDQALVVDCDLSAIDTARQEWPFFRDRRVDCFDLLTQRFLDQPQANNDAH